MSGRLHTWFDLFDWFVMVYFLLLNSSYLLLVAVAAHEMVRSLRRAGIEGYDDIFANPLTPAVSVLVPAHNEEAGIVESVRAMLTLRYPEFEIVVVDDGSTDATFQRLADVFDLVQVDRVDPAVVPVEGRVLSAHAPRGGEPILVIRKQSAGRRSDALNCGLNFARFPLVCMIDADSLLEEDALLRVVKPFVDEPARVVASGGVVRAANGSLVHRGRVVDFRLPRGWLARIQVVEYLRSFLLGRTGWSRFQGLVIISGAFGLFRRDVVLEVGGLDARSLAEDAELVVAVHQHLRRRRRPYRIVFVPDPVSWTEVPATRAVLGRQRRRWAHGLGQLLWKHRGMLGNPRYGRIGLVVLPYYLAFELLSPVFELVGVVTVAAGLALGAVNLPFALLFGLAAFGYGMLLSVAALAIEEATYHRYQRWADLGRCLAACLAENVGFRQLHAWWRLRGVVAAIRRRPTTWGVMTRAGFSLEVKEPG